MKLLNEESVTAYAKKGCKHCYGRGILEMSHPFLGKEWRNFCDCAIRGLQKDLNNNKTETEANDEIR